MDQTYMIILGVAVIVALGSVEVIRRRPETPATDGPDSRFAVSTEGMKICPKCGMGSLWTERRCSACGRELRG